MKYKVTKLSVIGRNSGVTIAPGIYRVFDYPQSVWDYLSTLPGVLEVIEEPLEAPEIKLKKEPKEKTK